MKGWLQKFRIPKSAIGIAMLGLGYYLKNQTLIDAGWAILGVGSASKAIKLMQGNEVFAHEKHLLGIKTKKEIEENAGH